MDSGTYDRLKGKLEGITGAAYVRSEPFDLEKYGRDETEDLLMLPDIAVLPGSEDEVAQILRLASELCVPVTPRGGGTGLSGGALPIRKGICLSLERMNAIVEIDEANMMVRAQPGVITATLQEAVEAKGLFYPPDPASRESCTLGGNLAEDAGGPRAMKYGVTSAYVRGLRAVLPDGEIISCGGKTLKDVAGYSLTQLLISSEGTLAVITEACLRLIPLPPYRRTLLAPFDELDAAARSIPAVMNRGIIPSALELMERPALEAVQSHLGVTVPHSDAAAHLLIEIDGFDAAAMARDVERCCEILADQGARDVLFAESRAKQEALWKTRRSIGEAVKSVSAYRELDTAVPRMMIPELVRLTHEVCNRHGVRLICYGHAGDGNLHMNVLIGDLTPKQWRERIPKVTQEVFAHVTRLGGTITGEHGVGIVAKPYLKDAIGARNVALMKGIKNVFDPRGILNPGKIFD
ncbi:MAG: FAD-linked oxidase C-terminal domain-containing protein [Planctomycetota bacterium]